MDSSYSYRRYSDVREVLADWEGRLHSLQGRRLSDFHAEWEVGIDGPEGWWVNGPVLLNFEGVQLELGASCCEFSVSVDTFRPDFDAVWGDEEVCLVEWRSFPWSQSQRFRGTQLTSLSSVEGWYNDDSKFKGLSFSFDQGSFCFFDAGDELGMTWAKLPHDPSLRWTLGPTLCGES